MNLRTEVPECSLTPPQNPLTARSSEPGFASTRTDRAEHCRCVWRTLGRRLPQTKVFFYWTGLSHSVS